MRVREVVSIGRINALLHHAHDHWKAVWVVVLNAVARRVIESRRGMHKERVFTYRSKPLGKLHSSAWKRAWKAAKLPTEPGILKAFTIFAIRLADDYAVRVFLWKPVKRCLVMPMRHHNTLLGCRAQRAHQRIRIHCESWQD